MTVIETEIETAIEIEIGIGRTDATDVEAVPQEAGVVPETGTDRETRTGTGIAIASEIETETVIAIVIVRLDVRGGTGAYLPGGIVETGAVVVGEIRKPVRQAALCRSLKVEQSCLDQQQ